MAHFIVSPPGLHCRLPQLWPRLAPSGILLPDIAALGRRSCIFAAAVLEEKRIFDPQPDRQTVRSQI